MTKSSNSWFFDLYNTIVNSISRKGEIAEMKKLPTVIPIPNPENTKKKVPVRLHERIRETRDPVVGLDFVQEYIAVSDPEMEPHYECELCGSKVKIIKVFVLRDHQLKT